MFLSQSNAPSESMTPASLERKRNPRFPLGSRATSMFLSAVSAGSKAGAQLLGQPASLFSAREFIARFGNLLKISFRWNKRQLDCPGQHFDHFHFLKTQFAFLKLFYERFLPRLPLVLPDLHC